MKRDPSEDTHANAAGLRLRAGAHVLLCALAALTLTLLVAACGGGSAHHASGRLHHGHHNHPTQTPGHPPRAPIHTPTRPTHVPTTPTHVPTTPTHTPSPPGTPTTPSPPRKGQPGQQLASQPAGIPGHWKLILDSEFKGGSYDQELWRPGWFGTGITGPINSDENACYSSQNVVADGDGLQLKLTAKPSTCAHVHAPYTGAVISTNPDDGRASGGFAFRYGVLQARVYLPKFRTAPADWPAVVTFGQQWPQDGEDDVIEVFGGTACYHFHSVGYTSEGDSTGYLGGCDRSLKSGWHTVAANWQPGRVTYYYDGVKVGEITKGVTSAPMYITLVNTVARGASVIAQANSMSVAYVKVWQQAS